jgi:hypothetical protein
MRGSGEWRYKDNVANEVRTFVNSTYRHVALPLSFIESLEEDNAPPHRTGAEERPD